MNYSVAIPTAADAACVTRVDLLLSSLVHFEPSAGPIVIVVDGEDLRPFQALLSRHEMIGEVIHNPRVGRGQGWLGRLTFGLWTAFKRLHHLAPDRHILRLDTDALVIAPFAERLDTLLRNEPESGMFGSSRLQPDGSTGGNWWHARVRRMGKWATRWEHWPYVRQNVFGTHAELRHLIRRACRFGYEYGDSVCGGGYLVRAEAVRDMISLSPMRDENFVATDTLTEDVFFSLVCQSLGWKLLKQNFPGDVFGVCWKGLPGQTLEAVAARGNAIIHSLKDHPPFTEAETQRYFAARIGAVLT